MRATRVLAAVVLAATVPALTHVAAVQAQGHEHTGVVSADPVGYTPHVIDGAVLAIAAIGPRVYVGGKFTTVVNAGKSAELTRNFIFAFDRSTGLVVDSFTPSVDGVVETIAPAPDGSSIIIGGRFKTVEGATQRSLAMLDPDGNRVSSFRAKTNGYVTKVLVRGDRLVAGGRFGKVNGVVRSNLALLAASTGELNTDFNIPVTDGRVKSNGTVTKPSIVEMDVDPTGSRLVIVGNFRRVGSQLRQQIAMIDVPGAAVTGWLTNRYPNDKSGSVQAFQCYQVFDTQMRDVEFSPDGSYFVVVSTGGAPDKNVRSLCDTTARWESSVVTAGSVETWKNCTGGDTLYSTAVTGAAVYVGGHQRWLDNCGGKDFATPTAFSAEGIGAIDPETGLAIRTWNPGRTRGVGAEELIAYAEGLYIGSDTKRLGGEYHARLGMFPVR